MAALLVANGSCVQAGGVVTNSVWVAVDLFDGRTGTASEYYGQIETKTLNDIVGHSQTNGFFRLESTHWFDDEHGLMRMEDAMQHGHRRGYAETAYFRVDCVTRIIPLAPAFVRDSLSRDAETQGPKAEPAPERNDQTPAR